MCLSKTIVQWQANNITKSYGWAMVILTKTFAKSKRDCSQSDPSNGIQLVPFPLSSGGTDSWRW
jgi:hypothetical protein